MAKDISFTIPGNPKALKRHRRIKKSTLHYDPSAKDKDIFLAIAYKHRPDKPIDSPISIDVNCYFQRPKSHYRTGKYSHLLKPNFPIYHISTPDCDNLVKFICDALNGVFWRDDRYIYSVFIQKLYDTVPRTEIKIHG